MGEMRREFQASDVSLVIPTYGREQVLLDTIQACLDQKSPAGEILIIDQSVSHELDTDAALCRWIDAGRSA